VIIPVAGLSLIGWFWFDAEVLRRPGIPTASITDCP